jgi:hypothetical protein
VWQQYHIPALMLRWLNQCPTAHTAVPIATTAKIHQAGAREPITPTSTSYATMPGGVRCECSRSGGSCCNLGEDALIEGAAFDCKVSPFVLYLNADAMTLHAVGRQRDCAASTEWVQDRLAGH